MKETRYVHGYSKTEAQRLSEQARALSDLLHGDSWFPKGSRVLEAGCGTGCQTVILASRNPHAGFTCIDCSVVSLTAARERIRKAGLNNAGFQLADIFHMPFLPGSFDHVFVCFVLEHLPDPVRALKCLMTMIRPGGTITVIEGDHGSAFFHPGSTAAGKAINCLVTLQAEMGGNSLIGRELYPLLTSAGFSGVEVSPRMVYVDHSRPDLEEGFTRQTFTAMVEGIRDDALAHGLITKGEWEEGIRDLYRTCSPDGTFCYTFFKGIGIRRG